MNISAAFIGRPIGTTLLSVAILLLGRALFPCKPGAANRQSVGAYCAYCAW